MSERKTAATAGIPKIFGINANAFLALGIWLFNLSSMPAFLFSLCIIAFLAFIQRFNYRPQDALRFIFWYLTGFMRHRDNRGIIYRRLQNR